MQHTLVLRSWSNYPDEASRQINNAFCQSESLSDLSVDRSEQVHLGDPWTFYVPAPRFSEQLVRDVIEALESFGPTKQASVYFHGVRAWTGIEEDEDDYDYDDD